MLKTRKSLFFALVVTMFLAGCGGKETKAPQATANQPHTLTLEEALAQQEQKNKEKEAAARKAEFNADDDAMAEDLANATVLMAKAIAADTTFRQQDYRKTLDKSEVDRAQSRADSFYSTWVKTDKKLAPSSYGMQIDFIDMYQGFKNYFYYYLSIPEHESKRAEAMNRFTVAFKSAGKSLEARGVKLSGRNP